MDDFDRQRLQGFVDLMFVGVDEVASFVEVHHRRTTDRTFDLLEAMPGIARPTRVVRVFHDTTLTVTYAAIRGVNQLVATTHREGPAMAHWWHRHGSHRQHTPGTRVPSAPRRSPRGNPGAGDEERGGDLPRGGRRGGRL